MKELLRTTASRVVVGSGLSRVARRSFPKRGTMILLGHRVHPDLEGYLPGLDPLHFEAQLDYLTRTYTVVRLSELVERLERGQTAWTNSIVLTFDDGFRDNYDNAFPLLKRYGAPATIFLVTGCLSDGTLPWPQWLGHLVRETQVGTAIHRLWGGRPGGARHPGRPAARLSARLRRAGRTGSRRAPGSAAGGGGAPPGHGAPGSDAFLGSGPGDAGRRDRSRCPYGLSPPAGPAEP